MSHENPQDFLVAPKAQNFMTPQKPHSVIPEHSSFEPSPVHFETKDAFHHHKIQVISVQCGVSINTQSSELHNIFSMSTEHFG